MFEQSEFNGALDSLSYFFCTCLLCRESMLGHIQPTELHVKMQDPSFLQEVQLIDVREADEVYDTIHNCCFYNKSNFDNPTGQAYMNQVNY